MKKLIVLVMLAAAVGSGCSMIVKPATPPGFELMKSRQQAFAHVQKWTVNGRVSIVSGQDGWNGTLAWKQLDRQHFDIRIIAPLGQGTLMLSGTPDQVVLRTSDGKPPLVAADAESLLYTRMGWQMPVSGMRYWVLGVPGPGPVKSVRYDKQGRPAELEQDGWQIRFLRYRRVNQVHVPDKMVFENARFRVKMIIKKWKLES